MKYQTNKKCLSLKILIEAYVNNNYYQAFVFKLRMQLNYYKKITSF